ncbi:MAG: hypothetical protein Q9170_002023 [Blastenia crenularia]
MTKGKTDELSGMPEHQSEENTSANSKRQIDNHQQEGIERFETTINLDRKADEQLNAAAEAQKDSTFTSDDDPAPKAAIIQRTPTSWVKSIKFFKAPADHAEDPSQQASTQEAKPKNDQKSRPLPAQLDARKGDRAYQPTDQEKSDSDIVQGLNAEFSMEIAKLMEHLDVIISQWNAFSERNTHTTPDDKTLQFHLIEEVHKLARQLKERGLPGHLIENFLAKVSYIEKKLRKAGDDDEEYYAADEGEGTRTVVNRLEQSAAAAALDTPTHQATDREGIKNLIRDMIQKLSSFHCGKLLKDASTEESQDTDMEQGYYQRQYTHEEDSDDDSDDDTRFEGHPWIEVSTRSVVALPNHGKETQVEDQGLDEPGPAKARENTQDEDYEAKSPYWSIWAQQAAPQSKSSGVADKKVYEFKKKEARFEREISFQQQKAQEKIELARVRTQEDTDDLKNRFKEAQRLGRLDKFWKESFMATDNGTSRLLTKARQFSPKRIEEKLGGRSHETMDEKEYEKILGQLIAEDEKATMEHSFEKEIAEQGISEGSKYPIIAFRKRYARDLLEMQELRGINNNENVFDYFVGQLVRTALLLMGQAVDATADFALINSDYLWKAYLKIQGEFDQEKISAVLPRIEMAPKFAGTAANIFRRSSSEETTRNHRPAWQYLYHSQLTYEYLDNDHTKQELDENHWVKSMESTAYTRPCPVAAENSEDARLRSQLRTFTEKSLQLTRLLRENGLPEKLGEGVLKDAMALQKLLDETEANVDEDCHVADEEKSAQEADNSTSDVSGPAENSLLDLSEDVESLMEDVKEILDFFGQKIEDINIQMLEGLLSNEAHQEKMKTMPELYRGQSTHQEDSDDSDDDAGEREEKASAGKVKIEDMTKSTLLPPKPDDSPSPPPLRASTMYLTPQTSNEDTSVRPVPTSDL